MSIEEKKKLFMELSNRGVIVYLDSAKRLRLARKGEHLVTIGDNIVDNLWNGEIVCSFGQVLNFIEGDFNLDYMCTLGSDPEIFITKDSEVIPSAVILRNNPVEFVEQDGFQVELHPMAHSCRQSCAYYLNNALQNLKSFTESKDMNISFSLAHKISGDIWKKTPKEIKKFGCSPTETAYKGKTKRVTGLRERFRAGGGHVHIGSDIVRVKQKQFVKLLDIVVGNTLVLIDRDPANITRRKNYGRAGEYRNKPYGLEYRVPSNFWLRSYILWSLTAGLVRNALTIRKNGFEEELLSLVNQNKIRKAINENNYDLALENFLIYKDFLVKNNCYFTAGVGVHNYKNFLSWVKKNEPLKDINDGTTEAILNDWEGRVVGFESFISNTDL